MSDDDPKSRPRNPTRRKFLLTSGSGVAASLVAGYVPAIAKGATEESTSALTEQPNVQGAVPPTLRTNGKEHSLRIHPPTTLLACTPEPVPLPETKKGCAHGQCGARTVHVNASRRRRCVNSA